MTINSNNFEKEAIFPEFNLNARIRREISPFTQILQNNDYNCCKTPEIIENKGLYVCRNCGVDYGPALKDNFSYDQKHETTISNKNTVLLFHYGARTIFALENLVPPKLPLFQRLIKLNGSFSNSYESNMTIACRSLLVIASQLQIPASIISYAFQIYIKVIKKRLTIGRNIKYLSVASLFIACHHYQYSCSLKELSEVSQIPEKIIRKNYRLILREFQIKLKDHSVSYYLSQYCIDLGLSIQFQNFAIKLLTSFLEIKAHPNPTPKALAIGAIYVVSKSYIREKRMTQQFLSIISNISEVTIRKYIEVLKNFAKIIYS